MFFYYVALLGAFSTQWSVVARRADVSECHGDPQCYCRSNCTTHFCTAMCHSDSTNWADLHSAVLSHALNVSISHIPRPPPLPDNIMEYNDWLNGAFSDSRRVLQQKTLPESYDFIDEDRPDCDVPVRDQKNGCDNCYDMAVHYMTSLTFCRRLEVPFVSSASLLTQCHKGFPTRPCKRTTYGFLSSMLLLKELSMVSHDCLPGPAMPKRNQIPECPKTCRGGNRAGDPLEPPIPPRLIHYALISGGEADMRRALYIQSSISVLMYADDGGFLTRTAPLDAEPYTCKPNHPTEFPTQYIHALCLYGWGTTDSEMPYWTFVNSWGAGWGDNGHSRIRRGQNDCYIESTQKVVVIFKDEQEVPNPTPPPNATTRPVVQPPRPPPENPDFGNDKDKGETEQKGLFTLTAGTVTLLGIAIVVVLGFCLVTCCYFGRWRLGPRVAHSHASLKSRRLRPKYEEPLRKMPISRQESSDTLWKNSTEYKTSTDVRDSKHLFANNAVRYLPSGQLKHVGEGGSCGLHRHPVEGNTLRSNLPRIVGAQGTMHRPQRLGPGVFKKLPEGTKHDAKRTNGCGTSRAATQSPLRGQIGSGLAGKNTLGENRCGENVMMSGSHVMMGRGSSPLSAGENTPSKNRGRESPFTRLDFMMGSGDSPRSRADSTPNTNCRAARPMARTSFLMSRRDSRPSEGRNIQHENYGGENQKVRILLPRVEGGTPKPVRGNSPKESGGGKSLISGSSGMTGRGSSPMSAGDPTPGKNRGRESPLARLDFMMGRGDSPRSAARNIPYENSGGENQNARVLLPKFGGYTPQFARGNSPKEGTKDDNGKARVGLPKTAGNSPMSAKGNASNENSAGENFLGGSNVRMGTHNKPTSAGEKARNFMGRINFMVGRRQSSRSKVRNISDKDRGGDNQKTEASFPNTARDSPRSARENAPAENTTGEMETVEIDFVTGGGGTPRAPLKNIPDKTCGGESPKTSVGSPKARGPWPPPKNIPDKTCGGESPKTSVGSPKARGPRPPPKNIPDKTRGGESPKTSVGSPKARGPRPPPKNVPDKIRGGESPKTFVGPPKARGPRPPSRNISDRNFSDESPKTSVGSPKAGGPRAPPRSTPDKNHGGKSPQTIVGFPKAESPRAPSRNIADKNRGDESPKIQLELRKPEGDTSRSGTDARVNINYLQKEGKDVAENQVARKAREPQEIRKMFVRKQAIPEE